MSSGCEIASRPLGVIWKIPAPDANTLLLSPEAPLAVVAKPASATKQTIRAVYRLAKIAGTYAPPRNDL